MSMQRSNEPITSKEKVTRLLKLLAPFKNQLIGASVLGVVVSILTVGQPLVIVQIVNSIMLSPSSVTRWLLVLVALLIAEFCVDLWQSRVVELAGISVLHQIRKDLIGKVMTWPTRQIRNYRSGDSVALMTNDVNLIRELVSSGLITLLTSLLTILLSVGILVYLDFILFFVCLVVFGITLAVIGGTISLIAIATEKQNEAVSGLVTKFEETVANITTISALNIRRVAKSELIGEAQRAFTSGKKIANYDALLGPVLTLTSNVSFIVILGVGGVRVANGSLGIGEFISFVLYFGMLVAPVTGGIQTVSAIQKAMGAATRLAAVLEHNPTRSYFDMKERYTKPASEQITTIEHARDMLRLNNVGFSHSEEDGYLFQGLSESIIQGDRVAVVGQSGVGKTTLLYLIAGLERPTTGEIVCPIKDDIVVAFVEQEPAVFSGTIRHNLTYGLARDVTEEELWEVLAAVGLESLVRKLPEKLDAVVVDKGANFSGGEKQRMAIARAMLFDAQLLILDEPTSNLDATNEQLLIEALDSLGPESSVVFVTHSPLLAQCANKVIAME